MRVNLLEYDLAGLEQLFISWGEKSFRAQQVFKWVHQQGLSDFSAMSNISKSLRARLEQECVIEAPEIDTEQLSSDGTRKWLLKVSDGNRIETVFIPETNRGTLCISSQVGCVLNCRFCYTALQGFNRNLTTAEIIGQVWRAVNQLRGIAKITNVVLMGMGEPLLNYDAVLTAMNIMRHDLAYCLPRKRVTLSTSGVIPGIDKLAADSDVALALSLHAPNDALRNELVPINKKYPISELMAACNRYAEKRSAKFKITMEYVMLDGVNDTPECAKQLIKVLSNVPCKINLIPFNPFPGNNYKRSKPQTILSFRNILIRAGFITTVRKTRGEDILAACGQLAGEVQDRTKRSVRLKAKIVES